MPENTTSDNQNFDLKEVSSMLGTSKPQLIKVIAMIEGKEKYAFGKDTENRSIFTNDDVENLKALYATKAENDLSWADTIEHFF